MRRLIYILLVLSLMSGLVLVAPVYAAGVRADRGAWGSPGNFGLDQGIVVMMIENHRTELIWRLMRACPYIRAGLRHAGFRGGWL